MTTTTDDTDTRPSAESFTQAAAPLRAQQTTGKVKEFIEYMGRVYSVGAFDMTYVDALGHIQIVHWDGESAPVFTTFKPKPAPTTEPSI